MNTSRRNARGEVSLRSILEETAGLVSRYGYDGTTIARITRVTGKPASSIYWFFDTKDELVAAALESTYRRGADDIPAWREFNEGGSLEQQLCTAFGDEFTPAETEAPVRLGIMVALEGSAAQSPVQVPFRRRRQRVRQQISEWWGSVADANLGPGREDVVEWMTLLTLAFLDGHYISDVEPVADPGSPRASLVSCALAGAFRHLAARHQPLLPCLPAGADEAEVADDDAAPGSVDTLLAHTRFLVAERGYEGATLSEICERAQIQRSSLYWRYKSKDELIHDAVAEPFLALVAASLPRTAGAADGWQAELAESVQRGVAAAMAAPDTVKAGLLLKLQRREPPTKGGKAIQAGLAREEAELANWIGSAVEETGLSADASALGWMVNVLIEGLLLRVAFGHGFEAPALTELMTAMIKGAVAAALIEAPSPSG